ncbi:MAG: hypothetical protein V4795_09085 [Pseudomonadota bacterium]
MRRLFTLLLPVALALAGCDQLGIESPASTKARVEADGKAIGGACRHAGRAIEDCYTLNKKADKAAIYAGWREMNEYMAENKLEPVLPVIPPEPPKQAKVARAAASQPDEGDGEGQDEPRTAAAKH